MAYTYKLEKNKRAVYIGVTDNPYRRNAEHSCSGKDYDTFKVTSPKVSRSEANWRETRNLDSYGRATGKKPKYNKTSDGKYHSW